MAQQIINNGTFDNDPSAEKIRTAFDKVNANFTELYNLGTNFKGEYSNLAALKLAHPSPDNGFYANINNGKEKIVYFSIGGQWQPIAKKPFHSLLSSDLDIDPTYHLAVITVDTDLDITLDNVNYFEGFTVKITNLSGGAIDFTSTFPLVGYGLDNDVLGDNQTISLVFDASESAFYYNINAGVGGDGIQQGTDSDEDIEFISLVTESSYPVGAEIPNTLYAVEQETNPTGYEQIFLATGQSITASTNTIISFTGGTFSSDGGFSLFNSDGKIIPLQENDVITYDIAFQFSTPATQGNYDVWIDVNGTRYRSVTKQMLKSNGVTDYFSASFILPIGISFFTNGGNIYINSSQAITISNKYCISSRVHKASLV